VRIVLEPRQAIGEWVCARAGTYWTDKSQAIGVTYDDGTRLVAGAVFDSFMGKRIAVHLAITEESATWTLMRAIARYAFGELGCTALTLMAPQSNLDALELHRRLGSIPEGCLVGASASGDDILLSRLPRESRIVQRMLRGG
jgi:hypothetical protein